MSTLDTKHKLATALKELMKKQTLEKITVTDIVNQCQVTRQTFYRNFEDKYALVNWYFEVLVQDSFEAMNGEKTLRQALENKFNFIEEEQTFFRVAFQSQSAQSLIEYDFRYIFNFYSQIIRKKTGAPLTPEVAFALELYCRGSISQTVAWVNQDKRPSPKEMALLLEQSLPPMLREFLIIFSEK